MKIAFLSYYSGIVERGAEVFTEELASRLADNFETYVFCGKKPAETKKYIPVEISRNDSEGKAGNRFFRKFYLDDNSRKIFRFTLEALKLIKDLKIDILIPVNGGWQTALVKLFCVFNRKKFVVSGQAGFGWDDKWNLYLSPDKFIALSEKGLFWCRKIAPWVEVVKIPNGVDLSLFKPGKKVNIPLNKPVIICAAALEKYKRIELTVRAVAELDTGSLLVLGMADTKTGNELDALGNKFLGPKRYLRKVAEHSQMPRYYNCAKVFTLVSTQQEAFGTVYAEAMACNLPVVATDDLLRREIISKAGIFVRNPDDPAEYGRKLKTALGTDFGTQPRMQAENYSWDKISKQYEKMFNEL